jgi:hypothetical protein
MAKEEMLAKLDADRKACREEITASQKEMVAQSKPETDIKTMA